MGRDGGMMTQECPVSAMFNCWMSRQISTCLYLGASASSALRAAPPQFLCLQSLGRNLVPVSEVGGPIIAFLIPTLAHRASRIGDGGPSAASCALR